MTMLVKCLQVTFLFMFYVSYIDLKVLNRCYPFLCRGGQLGKQAGNERLIYSRLCLGGGRFGFGVCPGVPGLACPSVLARRSREGLSAAPAAPELHALCSLHPLALPAIGLGSAWLSVLWVSRRADLVLSLRWLSCLCACVPPS